MRAFQPTDRSDLIRVLELDPALGDGIPLASRERATAECVAPQIELPVGPWRVQAGAGGVKAAVGLLVLDGLLVRRVGIQGRFGAELLGEGDVLQPGEGLDEPATLPTRTLWRVLEETRLAVLDESFTARIAEYPQLASALVGRAAGRARNIATNMAIVHQARVDVRLHMLFWHLAGRWGRVGRGGVSVPLRLTHAVLAELVAARRPTVTSALTSLSRRGLVCPTDQGWLLAGDSPNGLVDASSVTVQAAG